MDRAQVGADAVQVPSRFAGHHSSVTVEKTRELECPEQITIAAWIKLANPKSRGMIVSHEFGYRLSVNVSNRRRVRFQLNLDEKWAQNWLVGKTSLAPGRWYHVAGVYDGKQRRIYLDSQLDAAEPAPGRISEGRGFVIGAQSVRYGRQRIFKPGAARSYRVANPSPGTIDELKIWNRALSEQELARAAGEGRAAVQAGLPSERDLRFYTVGCVGTYGKETAYQFAVFNGGTDPQSVRLAVAITDPEGATVHESRHSLTLGAREKTLVSIPLSRPAECAPASVVGARLPVIPAEAGTTNAAADTREVATPHLISHGAQTVRPARRPNFSGGRPSSNAPRSGALPA